MYATARIIVVATRMPDSLVQRDVSRPFVKALKPSTMMVFQVACSVITGHILLVFSCSNALIMHSMVIVTRKLLTVMI